ncbi:MAG: DUF547 domain-containing protein, partial [Congregibacter sp.]|nr:DUF547 domain-containing protein [Congregibacter sp.]
MCVWSVEIKHIARTGFFAAVLLLATSCASIERLAIPDKQLLWPELSQSGTENNLSHAIWDQFLLQHTQVDDQGVVRLNYAGVSAREHQGLKTYIAGLSAFDSASLTRNAQLAYWVNLYNALTVDVVLDNYPVDSIRKIRDGPFDLGPWNDKRLTLHGRAVSLHDIEHGIVRPLWSDTPEVHYLLNCASIGCPNLSQRAYTGDTINLHLREAAVAYINDPGRGAFFRDDEALVVSR